MDYTLYLGDCLKEMDKIPDGSIDAIIADLPYGTTACSWDTVIPFEPMWAQFKRVIKERGAVVLFGSEPFSSLLRASNLGWFAYDWIWKKERGTGFVTSDRRPLMIVEIISVFYDKQPTYNHQLEKLDKPYRHVLPIKKGKYQDSQRLNGSVINGRRVYKTYTHRTPVQVLEFSRQTKKALHPTQKPVALLEYLIRTYTNEGETVLDCTMGSGTTGVACGRTGRKFIGIELLPEYCEIAENRIMNAYGDYVPTPKEATSPQLSLFDKGADIAP